MADKQAAAWNEIPRTNDTTALLLAVMNHPGIGIAYQIEAANALMRYGKVAVGKVETTDTTHCWH